MSSFLVPKCFIQLFCTFSKVWVCNFFWRNEISAKAVRKMLVKLILFECVATQKHQQTEEQQQYQHQDQQQQQQQQQKIFPVQIEFRPN